MKTNKYVEDLNARSAAELEQDLVAAKKEKQKELFEKIAVGQSVEGVVKNVTDFGAFIELEPGVDALLHVSQISYEHVNKPEDVYKVGDEVEAVVVECNADDKKISLSVKELLPAPEYTDDVAEDTEE